MIRAPEVTTIKNVSQFDDDVWRTGSFAYTTGRLSAQLANARMSKGIAQSYDFTGKTVLGLGCGDGAYTLEFVKPGVRDIVGVGPAAVAIDAASARALSVDATVKFEVGNIFLPESYISNNPVVKLIERYSEYHFTHKKRSLAPVRIFSWLITEGFRGNATALILMAPPFCLDWMAGLLRIVEPIIERLPLLRDMACGQCTRAAHQ